MWLRDVKARSDPCRKAFINYAGEEERVEDLLIKDS